MTGLGIFGRHGLIDDHDMQAFLRGGLANMAVNQKRRQMRGTGPS